MGQIYKYDDLCMNGVVMMGVAQWLVYILPHPPQSTVQYYGIVAVTVPTPTPRPSYAMPILTTPFCKVPDL